MPDRVKEKLVELLNNSFEKQYEKRGLLTAQHTAADLIANGVTVQECKVVEIDQFNKWISVKDGLPNLIPCDAGTAYSEAVNVLTSGRKVLTAIWDGFEWICDAEFWDAEDEEITHWTPVLLPLPQPPKGPSHG